VLSLSPTSKISEIKEDNFTDLKLRKHAKTISDHNSFENLENNIELEVSEHITHVGSPLKQDSTDGPKPPFLPADHKKKYTLVLDLDETLIHYNERASTLSLRPGAESFIRLMANLYEVVIWTAATEDYA